MAGHRHSRFAGASAAELLAGTDPADWPLFTAEVDAWRQRRTSEQALAELADAVRQLTDLVPRNIALALMSGIGPGMAAPYVRKLADDRVARGPALCWLAEHGMLAERELYDPDDLDSFADVLVCRLVSSGRDGLIASLALAGDDASQARIVTGLGTSPAPEAGAVLEVIGGTHPSKVVAKAARKALFLRRSRTT